MKLEVGILNHDKIETTGSIKKMRLSDNAAAMVFKMFTKSVYSDPIGTVIREITSNCFDSHVEAGTDSVINPVIVELKKEVSGHYISFIDKGVGMSPDRVLNIYGTYFESTKRDSNDQIGGFGIGGKTPLAYTQSFYVVTVSEKENEISYCKNEIKKLIDAIESVDEDGKSNYNDEFGTIEEVQNTVGVLTSRLTRASNQTEPKIEYYYNIFEGNDAPSIELLHLKPCDEPNGTEIKVPILEKDVNEFQQKTLRQLYYFENIIFKGFDEYVTNDYSLVKGKTFIYRGNTYSSSMHVCLGKVAYPIDWNALNLKQNDYQIPIAIRINIGELVGSGVTVSRESLDYSDANRKIIIKKINEAVEELKGLLEKQYSNIKTLQDYYNATENFGTLKFDGDRSIHVGRLVQKSKLNLEDFKYNQFHLPTREDILEKFFTVKLYGKKPKRKRGHSNEWGNTFSTIHNYTNIYHTGSNFKRVLIKQSYLRDSNGESFYLLEPVDLNNEVIMHGLLKTLGALKEKVKLDITEELQYDVVVPLKKAKKLVDDLFEDVFDLVRKETKSYDDVVVPDDYIEAKKQRKLSKETLKIGIPVKNCDPTAFRSNNRIEMKNLVGFTGRIYYGFADDRKALRYASQLFSAISGNSNISNPRFLCKSDYKNEKARGTLFVSISRQNEKYMKMLGKKAIHINYFYQTYVSRKVEKVIENKLAYLHHAKFEKVNEFYYDANKMKLIDIEIYNVARNIKDVFDSVSEDISSYVNEHKFKEMFNVDLKNLEPTQFKFKKELDWLTNITEKSAKRLKWIDFPWSIDKDNPEHQELIQIVQLLLVK